MTDPQSRGTPYPTAHTTADPTAGRTAYTTLPAGSEFRHELEIKRSRFIAVLRRVDDEAAARELVAELRREFYDARHHCSAFVIGPDRLTQGSNDDGEPAGTAGMPMLEALVRRETSPGVTGLSDVAAVVVRYFGGILLGAGGLVRAYSASVSASLDAACLVQRRRLRLFQIPVAHTEAGRLENDLRSAGFVMTETAYGPVHAQLGVALPDEPAAIEAAQQRLASITSGSARFIAGGSEWVDVP